MRREALEEGRRWLSQATEDLRWAKLLAREGGWHLAEEAVTWVGDLLSPAK